MEVIGRSYLRFVQCFLLNVCIIAATVDFVTSSEHVVHFTIKANNGLDALSSIVDTAVKSRWKREADSDLKAKCKKQEDEHLIEMKNGTRYETKHIFTNETHYNLALAWASDNDKGTLIVVTSEVIMMMFAMSSVYRSTDYGKSWQQIDNRIDNAKIRKDNGLQRNPHFAEKVYLVTHKEIVYVTEDGGETFIKRKAVNSEEIIAEPLVFHSNNYMDRILIMSNVRKLYVTTDNLKNYRFLNKDISVAKWGTDESDPGNKGNVVYIMKGPDVHRHPIFSGNRPSMYNLVKVNVDRETDKGTILLKRVVTFGIQGKFLYASIFKDEHPSSSASERLMMVSTDGGKHWSEAQLPTLTADRFYSVLDMTEGLIFMHVDNPGDTGHGTLYTSASLGVVYATSLKHHLYPNYGSVTDFYKVDSMRGTYLASQLNDDKSIHTVISFNRGADWTPVRPPADHSCTANTCYLQIHNYYSISRGVKANPPLSVESAVGLILVHGHVGDALQTTPPDVYITIDGGYTWRKTLDGPHAYQIGDSGGFIVAVPISDTMVDTIKFSTDWGLCWHEYKFTNESVIFTGALTEPGSKSMTISIWAYTKKDRKWVVFVINFAEIIKQPCDDTQYETWISHSEMRKEENKDVDGCLLGKKETFKRLSVDAWCRNKYTHKPSKDVKICQCTREDYECDYTYNRPVGSDLCQKDSNFHGKEIDVCFLGHEEKIITKGYRKIPGDICSGGVDLNGQIVNLTAHCANNRDFIWKEEAVVPHKGGSHILIATIVIIVIILVVTMSAYFGFKLYLLRKHKVVYRYSLLNTGENDYDNEFEHALTQGPLVYEDSTDDEELGLTQPKLATGPSPQHTLGTQQPLGAQHTRHKVKSYHDDSDVDMLE